MKKSRILSKKFLLMLAVLFLSFFCLSCSCCASANSTCEIPTEQYNQLNMILAQQEVRLITLSEKCKKLKAQSPELVKQLEIAEAELKICQEQLTSANNSLVSALATIDKLEQSCNKLEAEMKQIKRVSRRRKIQRTIAYVIAGTITVLQVHSKF